MSCNNPSSPEGPDERVINAGRRPVPPRVLIGSRRRDGFFVSVPIVRIPSIERAFVRGVTVACPGPTAVSDVVLVTGAAGFVGSAVVRQALAAGFHVRAMMRGAAQPGNLAGLAAEVVRADMRDPVAGRTCRRRRALRVPRRSRLSALGARPGGDRPQQPARHADRDGRGAPRRGRTDRLHQQRGHAQAAGRRASPPTNPRCSPRTRRSAPTSAARWSPSASCWR